jgi:hypothetical protein
MTPARARASLCSLIAILIGAAGAANAAEPTSSSAYGLQARFTAHGLTTGLGPIGALSGSAPPNYAKVSTLGPIQKTIALTTDGPVPGLVLDVTSVHTHLAANVPAPGVGSAEGDSTLKSLDLNLIRTPLPPGTSVPVQRSFLRISADKIQSTAALQSAPSALAPATTATFAGLLITGSLLDGQIVSLSGEVPDNTVIFQNAAITITLNQRLVAGVISCTPKCIFSPVSVTETAIDVTLTNADLDGKIVSGDIALAVSQAGGGFPPLAGPGAREN